MRYKCRYEGCSYSRKSLKVNPEAESKIYFIPFPKPRFKREKCIEWIKICRPYDDEESFLKTINKKTYICSKHFLGENGPTLKHPNPIAFIPKFHIPECGVHLQDIITPVGWMIERDDKSCTFYKKQKEAILLKFKITTDFRYDLHILNQPAKENILAELPPISSLQDVVECLLHVDKLKICLGTPDENLVKAFKNSNLTKGWYCDATKSVYSNSCKQVCKKFRCRDCLSLRCNLFTTSKRMKQSRNGLNEMTREALVRKVKRTEMEAKRQRERLSKLILKLRRQKRDSEKVFTGVAEQKEV